MIDFYWLKSFTETIQFFISILFLVCLNVKYQKWDTPICWFVAFLGFKIVEDFYGIVNYTSWIRELLTRNILGPYFFSMGFLDLSMLICLVGFTRALALGDTFHKKQLLWFIPAVLIIPSTFLSLRLLGDIRFVFDLVRLSFIAFCLYFFFTPIKIKSLQFLMGSIFFWNVLWITETELHEALGIISESASWVIFVFAELCLTIGISYFFLQVIARPKVLLYTSNHEGLSTTISVEIANKLAVAMKDEKRYRDQELNLTKLAEHLQLPTQDITQYLNRVQQMNFNQYLSKYRIAEARELLQSKSNEEMNVQEIMFYVGYNSKSVFNTAFKSATGMTPSMYRKSAKNE